MSKMYIATIMNRIVLGNDNYLFVVSHPEIGTLDEKTNFFTDRNGFEYAKMLDPSLLMSEIPRAYYNLQELDSLKDSAKDKSMKDAIADYAYHASRYVYFVTKNENKQVYTEYIDLDKMKSRFAEVLGVLAKGEVSKEAMFLVNTNPNSSDISDDKDKEDSDEIPFHGLTSDTMRNDISNLFLEIQEGVYSLDELKKILENVNSQREDIEDLIMGLELQIEASENGESVNDLKGDSEEKLSEDSQDSQPAITLKEHFDLNDICKKVTKTVISQDEAVKRVVTEIARKEQSSTSNRRALLVTGPTGCGKTKMIEMIAKYINRPFHKIDATQLTIPGYVGKNIEEALWDLYIKCGRDKKKAEHAIIFIDEIDKKGSNHNDDISGKGVLNVLLPFIEGETYNASESVKRQDEVVQLNTSNMIIILSGAFNDVYKNLTEKGSIGFASEGVDKKEREATIDDFIDKGRMPDEFMGRVSVIKLNPLDFNSIKRILLESDESAIKVQEKIFAELGVKITFRDDYIDAVATQADKRNTGARGLNTVVDETTWVAYNDCYSHIGDYDEVILSEETVRNPENYQKILKKK